MVQSESCRWKFGLQTGELEATFDGTLVSALDLGVNEGFRDSQFVY
jgi:hypothetical protein